MCHISDDTHFGNTKVPVYMPQFPLDLIRLHTFQYESLPWYKGQMTEKQVECSFELCNKSGSYLAYKTEDDQLRLGIKTVEDSEHGVLHLGVDRTPNGAFIVKYGNNDPITRDSLLDVIEHYQVVPLSLGDGTPEIVLTEPWLRSSL